MSLDPDALRVLRRTLTAYGGCSTYRDCGRVLVRPAASKGPSRELFFTTDFVRPDRLRFDVGALTDGQQEGSLDVATVLWDGHQARAYRAHFEGDAGWPTLGAALAWAVRLDGPASEYLVHLLFGIEFAHADEPRAGYLGLEDFEGVDCHKIRLPSSNGHSEYLLWIDAESDLLRGLHEHRDHRVNGSWGGGAPAHTTFEFYPALDVPVDERVFRCGKDAAGRARLERFLEL